MIEDFAAARRYVLREPWPSPHVLGEVRTFAHGSPRLTAGAFLFLANVIDDAPDSTIVAMFNVEHVAWQVADPEAVAAWYGKHLGFRIVRKNNDPARTHFIVDNAGRVLVEIYNNPAAAVPDYGKQHPLVLHLAFKVDDPAASRDALMKVGCTVVDDVFVTPAGDQLCMMRDPFGFAIQLCKRAKAMV